MKRSLAIAGVLTILELAAAPQSDLLTRMASINPNLHSFSATLHAHVTMKSFPFIATDLVGTYYYKEPDKTKVVFTSGVPLVASQFNKLYARIENPSRWPDVYHVTLVRDEGGVATFRLVPRKQGNVDRVDATVDDKSATVVSMQWNYGNGGYAEMTNHYRRIQGNLLVQSQKGHVEEPGYIADLSSTIENYKINPSLPDSVFEGQ